MKPNEVDYKKGYKKWNIRSHIGFMDLYREIIDLI